MPQTIRAVQPDVVVVELCQYRVSMLKMDEKTLLKEAKDINLEKVQQAIKQVSHYTEDCVDMVITVKHIFHNLVCIYVYAGHHCSLILAFSVLSSLFPSVRTE